jgi:prophage tail gpP-like protein
MSLQDTVDQITEELARAYGEIKAEIAQVQAQLDAANVPAEQVDLSALQAAADLLDGIVPDEPTEPEGDVEVAKRDNTEDK